MGTHRKMRSILSCLVIAALLSTGMAQTGSAAVRKIGLNKKSLTLSVGQKKTLKVKNTKKKITWKSKNKRIAVVSRKGVVRAKKAGKTTIIAKVGKKQLKCKVVVRCKSAKPTRTNRPRKTAIPTKQPLANTQMPTVSAKPTNMPQPTVTPVPTPTQVPVVLPTLRPDVDDPTDAAWQTGKNSGTAEDYEKYFAINSKDYTKLREGAVKATVQSVTYSSSVLGVERYANVVLPPGYSEDETYPVVYMLHGYACDRSQWLSLSLATVMGNMICSGEVPPFIAVLPSIEDIEVDEGYTITTYSTFSEEFTKDLEPYIFANYPVSHDRKDTAICGTSYGGKLSIELGFTLQGHFNYIGAFAPPSVDVEDGLTFSDSETAPKLVFVCGGSNDEMVYDCPQMLHEQLVANNVDHIWYLQPGGEHDYKVFREGMINFMKRCFR